MESPKYLLRVLLHEKTFQDEIRLFQGARVTVKRILLQVHFFFRRLQGHRYFFFFNRTLYIFLHRPMWFFILHSRASQIMGPDPIWGCVTELWGRGNFCKCHTPVEWKDIDHLKLINQRVKNSQSCLIDTGMKLQLLKKSFKWTFVWN